MKARGTKKFKKFVVEAYYTLKWLKEPAVAAGYFALCVCAAALLYSTVVYFLWNALMPEIFGLTTINFWQATGLTLLVNCLFGHSSSVSSTPKEV